MNDEIIRKGVGKPRRVHGRMAAILMAVVAAFGFVGMVNADDEKIPAEWFELSPSWMSSFSIPAEGIESGSFTRTAPHYDWCVYEKATVGGVEVVAAEMVTRNDRPAVKVTTRYSANTLTSLILNADQKICLVYTPGVDYPITYTLTGTLDGLTEDDVFGSERPLRVKQGASCNFTVTVPGGYEAKVKVNGSTVGNLGGSVSYGNQGSSPQPTVNYQPLSGTFAISSPSSAPTVTVTLTKPTSYVFDPFKTTAGGYVKRSEWFPESETGSMFTSARTVQNGGSSTSFLYCFMSKEYNYGTGVDWYKNNFLDTLSINGVSVPIPVSTDTPTAFTFEHGTKLTIELVRYGRAYAASNDTYPSAFVGSNNISLNRIQDLTCYRFTIENQRENIVLTGANITADTKPEDAYAEIFGGQLEIAVKTIKESSSSQPLTYGGKNYRITNTRWELKRQGAVAPGGEVYWESSDGSSLESFINVTKWPRDFRFKSESGYGKPTVKLYDVYGVDCSSEASEPVLQNDGYWHFSLSLDNRDAQWIGSGTSKNTRMVYVSAVPDAYTARYVQGDVTNVSGLPVDETEYNAVNRSRIAVPSTMPSTTEEKYFSAWSVGNMSFQPGDNLDLADLVAFADAGRVITFTATWQNEEAAGMVTYYVDFKIKRGQKFVTERVALKAPVGTDVQLDLAAPEIASFLARHPEVAINLETSDLFRAKIAKGDVMNLVFDMTPGPVWVKEGADGEEHCFQTIQPALEFIRDGGATPDNGTVHIRVCSNLVEAAHVDVDVSECGISHLIVEGGTYDLETWTSQARTDQEIELAGNPEWTGSGGNDATFINACLQDGSQLEVRHLTILNSLRFDTGATYAPNRVLNVHHCTIGGIWYAGTNNTKTGGRSFHPNHSGVIRFEHNTWLWHLDYCTWILGSAADERHEIHFNDNYCEAYRVLNTGSSGATPRSIEAKGNVFIHPREYADEHYNKIVKGGAQGLVQVTEWLCDIEISGNYMLGYFPHANGLTMPALLVNYDNDALKRRGDSGSVYITNNYATCNIVAAAVQLGSSPKQGYDKTEAFSNESWTVVANNTFVHAYPTVAGDHDGSHLCHVCAGCGQTVVRARAVNGTPSPANAEVVIGANYPWTRTWLCTNLEERLVLEGTVVEGRGSSAQGVEKEFTFTPTPDAIFRSLTLNGAALTPTAESEQTVTYTLVNTQNWDSVLLSPQFAACPELVGTFRLPAVDSFWITDHADAGAGRTHLAFQPFFDGPLDMSVWIPIARENGWVHYVAADTEAELASAPLMDDFTFRDGTGEQDAAKGWCWITVPCTNKLYKIVIIGQDQLGGVQLWEGGPYFSGCNVGATSPEGFGYYFWWGDTNGYTQNVSKTGWVSVADGKTSILFAANKYPESSTFNKTDSELYDDGNGYIDAPTIEGKLKPKYDAATAHWGTPWRMPTGAEMSDLSSRCDSAWTNNWNGTGVSGCLVKGRGTYASRSIFLPATGFGMNGGLTASPSAYWASQPAKTIDSARLIRFSSNVGSLDATTGHNRYFGFTIRPVRDAAK